MESTTYNQKWHLILTQCTVLVYPDVSANVLDPEIYREGTNAGRFKIYVELINK